MFGILDENSLNLSANFQALKKFHTVMQFKCGLKMFFQN